MPDPRFAILEYEIEGNSVLPVAAIERAVMPHLGEGKTVKDVEAARAALEKAYQDAGFLTVFVDVPEQRVSEGVVLLSVLEGRVGRLAVTGSRYYSQGYIRQNVPELAEGKVPNFNVVQTQLAEVNRNESRRVQPVLRPGLTPGTVETELQVADKLPLGGRVELHNNHAQFTEPWRLQATVRYDNLFQADHTISLTAITAPQDPSQSKVLALSYTAPLPGGDAWLGYLVVSDSLIEPLGTSNIIGKGTTAGIRRVWTLPALPTYTHTLSAGIDYKDQKEDTIAGTDKLSTPLRYAPLALGYNGNWAHADQSQTQLGLTALFNLRTVLQRDVPGADCSSTGTQDQFACKRSDADGGFSVIKADAKHTHPALGNWLMQWKLGAQLASQPLVGLEQYALGGADTVRGYLEAEAIGDDGLMASVELRTPNQGRGPEGSWRERLDEIVGYGFIDVGWVKTLKPTAGQQGEQSISGAGFGLKLRAYQQLDFNLDLAWPLRSTPKASGGYVTEAGEPRVHVRLGAEF